MSPYQALFGRPPPTIPMYTHGCSSLEAFDLVLSNWEKVLCEVKLHLQCAQRRMKTKKDKHQKDISFEVGDLVFVKL